MHTFIYICIHVYITVLAQLRYLTWVRVNMFSAKMVGLIIDSLYIIHFYKYIYICIFIQFHICLFVLLLHTWLNMNNRNWSGKVVKLIIIKTDQHFLEWCQGMHRMNCPSRWRLNVEYPLWQYLAAVCYGQHHRIHSWNNYNGPCLSIFHSSCEFTWGYPSERILAPKQLQSWPQ